ncbi:MAG: MoaD family protein [Candidatus Omnitrophica bacterium]|nr:MoaD family protein [Candidatus Omnitrophota bacterium]
MAVKVRIPTPLQKLTNNQSEVACEAKNIDEMLAQLEKKHAGIKERLCDEGGKLRRFVNIYVNEEDIRFLEGQSTALKDGDDVSIIPAIAGGAQGLVKKRVTLVFPQDQIREPAVFTMAKQFDILPNIRKARVTESVGEMMLELEGTEKNLAEGIKYLESRGIKVEPVTGESAL